MDRSLRLSPSFQCYIWGQECAGARQPVKLPSHVDAAELFGMSMCISFLLCSLDVLRRAATAIVTFVRTVYLVRSRSTNSTP